MIEYSTYFYVFIIGLSYGATACMFSCMPFLTPLLISNSNSTKEALGVILPFSFGRVFSYTILSTIAYLSSFWVKRILDDTVVSNTLLGSATIIMGIFILYKSFTVVKSCSAQRFSTKKTNKIGFFTLGATISLNPCAPVLALLAVAVNSKAIYNAIGIGIFFGAGAVLFSILFYGFVFSKIIRGVLVQFSMYKLWVERLTALFLVVLGITILDKNLIF
ncbi:MAG: sulfite exporter TauE/SafE family protein [Campylobacteraceae bacterium]|nr:sulfite exporter TauE/SafE family protein [Campylobacteraceae bacterium]